MTARDALSWELEDRIAARPYQPQESAPAAWLVVLALALLAVVVYRLVDKWIAW